MFILNISQNSRVLRLVLALAFGLVLLIGLLLAMGAGPPGVALAQGSTNRHVDCVSGSDSGDCTASPCQTIGYALSQANNGDTIRVAACTYTESLTLDKSVSLMGDGADDTIIHALNGQRVMTITGATITNSTVISGFTFTGGNPVADVGGGLLVTTSAPTIRNNHIISNTIVISYNGGGLYLHNSNGLLLSDNLISGNSTITGCGGGLYFDNSANATLTGNTISDNKASPFPSTGAGGKGGGVFFDNSPEATLSYNIISDNNRATEGGGLYFRDSPTATLRANTISDNVGNHKGGGMKGYGGVLFYRSDNATLIGNTIRGNRAPNWCAGVCFLSSDNAVLMDNAIISNTKVQGYLGWGVGVYFHASTNASLANNVISHNTGEDINKLGTILGGGLYIGPNSTATLISNIISLNGATRGGGLYAGSNSTVVLMSNIITGNAVYDSSGDPAYDSVGYGGGLYLNNSAATLTNTVVADNRAETTGKGSGLYIVGSSPQLLQTTIARNSGGDGSGVHITGTLSNVALTNTIFADHSVGITVTAGNTATLNGVLGYSNTINYGGEGYITVTDEYTGAPAFAADGYHLTLSSEAIDRGVDAGVTTDIDGYQRPCGLVPDLGADEINCLYVPVILKNSG